MTVPLLCPICGEPLTRGERTLSCAGGHSFDLAASGYCNLLRPGKQRNRTSGDDREMVSARSRFLSRGYYRPVLDRVLSLLSEVLPDGGFFIDAGCGEGFYTNGIALSLPGTLAFGIDVSKFAADAAARGAGRAGISDRVFYAVATSAAIPVPDGAAECVLSLFSPCRYDEFARVTKRGGHLLIGSAGKEHLRELKQVLYGEGNVHPNVPINHPALSAPFGYEPVSRESVSFMATVTGDDIAALFSMTPYRWRTPQSGISALSGLESIDVTVDVDFTLLKLK